ncbi:hypothetical protein ACUOFU_06385 [Microbacterium arabinogalactanolyticum]
MSRPPSRPFWDMARGTSQKLRVTTARSRLFWDTPRRMPVPGVSAG